MVVSRALLFPGVMTGLLPAIHALDGHTNCRDVDARHKAGHDENRVFISALFRGANKVRPGMTAAKINTGNDPP
jgi:hypothetical protein